MKAKHYVRLVGGLPAGGAAMAAAAYATYAGITWYRYGRTKHQVSGEESDSLLDLYMPKLAVFATCSIFGAGICLGMDPQRVQQ